ncbi:MAG: hypothetical protein IPG88_24235, partial [Gemmatimonadetes bacterium]|nr:hypothetical protein [Gemmatimonadota bacterium]
MSTSEANRGRLYRVGKHWYLDTALLQTIARRMTVEPMKGGYQILAPAGLVRCVPASGLALPGQTGDLFRCQGQSRPAPPPSGLQALPQITSPRSCAPRISPNPNGGSCSLGLRKGALASAWGVTLDRPAPPHAHGIRLQLVARLADRATRKESSALPLTALGPDARRERVGARGPARPRNGTCTRCPYRLGTNLRCP